MGYNRSTFGQQVEDEPTTNMLTRYSVDLVVPKPAIFSSNVGMIGE